MENVLTIDNKYLDRDDNGYLYHNGSLFTGKSVWYLETGQLVTEAYYENGIQDGYMRGWYENGQLKSITLYKEGCVVGNYKRWYENGQLKLEAEVGKWKKEWDQNGNLILDYKNEKFYK